MWSWVADGPERSWVTWSGGRGRSAVAVFRHRGGCRWALRGLPFLVALGAGGTGGAALRRAVRWPPPVTPSRRRAVWPCARLPITTAAALCPDAVTMFCSLSGASQCSAPHRDVYAGSTAITARPWLAAIWASRSRNFPVGRRATIRRYSRPRFPRDGL